MASEKCGLRAKPSRAVPQGAFRRNPDGFVPPCACPATCGPANSAAWPYGGCPARLSGYLTCLNQPASPPTSCPCPVARGAARHLPSRHAPGVPVAGLSTRRPKAETARPPPATPPERPPVSESPTWGTAPCVRLPERRRPARHLRRIRIPTPAPSGRQQREKAPLHGARQADAPFSTHTRAATRNSPVHPKQKAHPCE